MEWGFNSPLAHEEAADPFGICGFCFPWLLLVVPRVFRAPRGLSRGPGCLMHPWAVARPLAVRAASFARRVALKPGQAPPPPTGTAADPSGVLRTCGAGLRHGRRPARSPSALRASLGASPCGYRTLGVAGGVTFWLSGAGKSVF